MMFEEEERRRPGSGFTPAALAEWSEEALRDYIATLRAEIERAEAAIAARGAQRAAAEAFFRKP
ncbi:Protein of unknown function [Roseomonas rosea]|jgi:uncharacterized small protein (DUF1192 family)|uniref:DUF1192 domain-containing protein n=1 Tax=Muricoccus roseus TaxID=198092 RepID=A0A1M6AZ99_9PROT|nr:DUF1192 family protein [Roseomonas rosea]SHI41800.1 Protein of unknown function [Roseomonas rosea]